MNKIYLLVYLVLISACVHKASTIQYRQSAQSFQVTSTRSFFADAEGAPSAEVFNASVNAALSGNDAQLAYVLSLARYTDGESSLSYGSYLSGLQMFVGSKRFKHAMKALTHDEKINVKGDMNGADKMWRFVQEHN